MVYSRWSSRYVTHYGYIKEKQLKVHIEEGHNTAVQIILQVHILQVMVHVPELHMVDIVEMVHVELMVEVVTCHVVDMGKQSMVRKYDKKHMDKDMLKDVMNTDYKNKTIENDRKANN